MSKITGTIYHLRLMDELAQKESFIHRLHPLTKLLTTILYLIVVVSYDKYAISGLVPLLLYPIVVLIISDIPLSPLLRMLLVIEPFILVMGIFNPIFNHQMVVVGNLVLSKGWLTFLSLVIKSILTLSATMLLIATTGIHKLCEALLIIKVPRIFVLLLLMTYRYISVLLEEVSKMTRAYFLRAPAHKGIRLSVAGSLVGQLILRTYDRATRIYQAMCLRGYTGQYHAGSSQRMALKDYVYLGMWVSFFSVVRVFDISKLLGRLVEGVIK